jgi:hypothetical protein
VAGTDVRGTWWGIGIACASGENPLIRRSDAMPLIQHILAATDLSGFARHAVDRG